MASAGVQWRAVCNDHEGDEVPWEDDREEVEEHAELMREVLGCRNVRIEQRTYLRQVETGGRSDGP